MQTGVLSSMVNALLFLGPAFLVIAFVKVFRGVRGTDAILWNAVGVITLLYLFTSVAWIASGGLT